MVCTNFAQYNASRAVKVQRGNTQGTRAPGGAAPFYNSEQKSVIKEPDAKAGELKY